MSYNSDCFDFLQRTKSRNNNISANCGNIGFCGLLTIVFIVLKLCHVIEWTWLWVLAPLWVPFVIVIVALAIVFLAAFIIEVLDKS